jgi:Na+/proline symporter
MQGLFGQQSVAFWAVLILYTALLAGLSFYFTRFVKTSDDFFRASQHTPWWVAGLSFFMTAFSAAVFVSRASFAYQFGGLALFSVVAMLPTFLLGFYLFSRKWHRAGCATAVEYIERRYGLRTARFFILTGVPIRILDNANRLYVTAVLVSLLFNCSLFQGVVITAAIAVLYTVTGGFLAVAVTDTLQAFVMAIIVVVIAGLSYVHVGGLGNFIASTPSDFWSLSPNHPEYNIPFELASGLVGIFSWNGYWSLVQRFVSVRTERDARKVALTGGVAYVLLFPLFALPPIFASVLVPGLDSATQAETSYLRIAQMLLPSSLLGLFCFALFAATITALNSELNVISQVLVNDAFKRTLARVSDRTRLLIGRMIVLVVTGFCMAVAMYIPDMGGSFRYLMILLGMTSLPTFVPLLGGLFFRRTAGAGAVAAFVAGLSTSAILRFGLEQTITVMVFANFVATAGVYLLAGWLFPVRDLQRRREVDAMFERLGRPNAGDVGLSEEAPTSGMGALNLFRICGVCLLLMAGVLLLCSFGSLATHGVSIGITIALFSATGLGLWWSARLARNRCVGAADAGGVRS